MDKRYNYNRSTIYCSYTSVVSHIRKIVLKMKNNKNRLWTRLKQVIYKRFQNFKNKTTDFLLTINKNEIFGFNRILKNRNGIDT